MFTSPINGKQVDFVIYAQQQSQLKYHSAFCLLQMKYYSNIGLIDRYRKTAKEYFIEMRKSLDFPEIKSEDLSINDIFPAIDLSTGIYMEHFL